MRIPLRIGGHESRDKTLAPAGVLCVGPGPRALERGWRVPAPSGERGNKPRTMLTAKESGLAVAPKATRRARHGVLV